LKSGFFSIGVYSGIKYFFAIFHQEYFYPSEFS
jgi:hypothetical protein